MIKSSLLAGILIGLSLLLSAACGADPTATPIAKLPSPTPTAQPTATPTSADSPTPTPTATLVPTVPPSKTPTNTPTPTTTSTLTPSPTPKSAGGPWIRPSDGMTMVYVPVGPFTMGSESDEMKIMDQWPQHSVNLDGFWIDRTEMTNQQYRQCVEAGSCDTPGCWDENMVNEPEHPVVCVDWFSVKAFCSWASTRLPTEAEWGKAARGTDGQLYPWGDEFDYTKGNFDDETWHDVRVVPGGAGCDGYEAAAPVGSFPGGASPYGVLDMAGSACEWVADWFKADVYAKEWLPAQNPKGASLQSTRYRETTI